MAIKTFNLDDKIYKEFAKHCKKEGFSMSRKVENFIKGELGKLQASGKVSRKLKVSVPSSKHSFQKYC
jgi:hypothetical protein